MDANSCFDEVKFKYGFDFTLKEEQSEILNIILNEKKNVFAVLPTGFGKSSSFMLPPILLDQVRIILCCSSSLLIPRSA